MTTEESEVAESTFSAKIDASKWLKKKVDNLRWRAHFWLPNLINSHNENERGYYEERDRKENIETRVPDGEALRVFAVWAVEVFGPSEIDALYENFQRLGWDGPRLGSDSSGSVHWIKEQRMYGSSGNYNIGLVTRRTDKRFHGVNHFASLPNEVEHLFVYVYQLSTSLTCVRVGFVLSDEAANWYQQELATDRKTTRISIRKKRTIAIYGVGHIKTSAVKKIQARYRAIATDWFKKEIPGFFSSAKDGIRLPTAELLTTEVNMFFSESESNVGRRYFDWRKIVLNVSPLDVWRNVACEGLQLAMDESIDDARYHTVIALRTLDVSDEQLQCWGGRTKNSIVNFCENEVGGVLVYYAGLAFLRDGDRTVKLTRERLRVQRGDKDVLEVLRNIKTYFTDSIGQPAIASELLKGTQYVGSYRHWCENFTMDRGPKGGGKYSLPDVLCERTKHLAAKFLEEETASREQFEQLSSILNTQESIKAQKRMELLTMVVLFVSFASLFAALAALTPPDKWLGKVQSIYQFFLTCLLD